jgi:hypothetical protein
MKSRIQKLSLELTFETGTETREKKGYARRIYNEQVLPALGAAIEGADEDEQDVFLEKIELDLGRIDEPGLESKLKFLLSEKLRELRSNSGNQGSSPETHPAPGFYPAPGLQESIPDALEHYFIRYLLTGMLPIRMHEMLTSGKNVLTTWLSGAFGETSGTQAARVISALSGSPAAIRRLLFHSDNRTFQHVVAFCIAQLPGEPGRKIMHACRIAFGNRFSHRTDADSIAEVMVQILLLSRTGLPKEELQVKIAELATQIEIPGTKINRPENSTISSGIGSPLSDAEPLPESMPSGHHIPVPNAGLVILGPFLPRLFSILELTDAETGNFRDAQCRHRAMHLLQVVSGQKGKHFDFLLPLNKIICGIDPHSASNPVFKSTARENKEIRIMLDALLHQWAALKSSSVRGIQQLFLVRGGIVEMSDNSWTLHVENAAYDILLDKIPWSIQVLKFPWSNYVLYVDWKY